MLGFGLRRLREERDEAQKLIAAECGVSQSAVSRWESSGKLPDEHVDCVCRSLGIEEWELRAAIPRAFPGQKVNSDSMIRPWTEAVGLSNHSPNAKVVMTGLTYSRFLDHDSWIVEVAPAEVADVLGMSATDVESVWEEVSESPFVESVTRGGDVFSLRFPSD